MPIIIIAVVGIALAALAIWYPATWLARVAIERPGSNPNHGKIKFLILLSIFSFGAAAAIDWWAGVAVFTIGAVAYQSIVEERKRLGQAIKIIAQHAKELAIKRKQLVVKDSYGLVDAKKWEKEKYLFINKIIEPTAGSIDIFSPNHKIILSEIEDAADRENVEIGFSDDLSPIEYERLVADALQRCGWEVRLTKTSGDQGVDVVAEKSGNRVVIQCKLYSRPVGNAAVQEVIAGRAFEKAKFAAVVTNNTYTMAAKQLAESAAVLLLHHDQLPDLEAKLTER